MRQAEKTLRETAQAFHEAIVAAKAAGFTVAWPHSAEGLPGIAISETGKASVIVQVAADVDPALAAKAGEAAQTAADKVMEKAAAKR